MMSVVKGERKNEEVITSREYLLSLGTGGRDSEGRGRGGWVGEGESSREAGVGDVEVRGWLKAMGRAHGSTGGLCTWKTLGAGGHSLKFKLGGCERRNELSSPHYS